MRDKSKFQSPLNLQSGQTAKHFLRARDPKTGKFVKSNTRKKSAIFEVFESRNGENKSIGVTYSQSELQTYKGFIVKKKRGLTDDEKRVLMYRNAEVYDTKNIRIVSNLPERLLKSNLNKRPSAVYFEAVIDGQIRTFNVMLPQQDNRSRNFRRVKRLRKDNWEKTLSKWAKDLEKRFDKYTRTSFQPVGFRLKWEGK